METRKPLPRGPVTFAEEQMAQLIGEVKETNRLLGRLLSQQPVAAPGPAATETIREPAQQGAHGFPHGPLERRDEGPPGEQPPDSEVKPLERPGTAPAKRAGRR